MVANLVDHLNKEWSLFADTLDDDCTAWSAQCLPLEGCRTPAQVLAAIRSDPDTVLGFLLARYQLGERMAGRVTLQAMLGKLVRMSYTGAAADQPNAVDDLVTHMWCQIAKYPLDRRPRSIAANLALDSLKAARQEWIRSREVPVPPALVVAELEAGDPAVQEVEWRAEEIIATAFELSLITSTTRDILVAVYGPEGMSGASAAARWGCSPAAIRTRCATAVREQLAPLAQQLLLAA